MRRCKHCGLEIERGFYCPACYGYLRKHPEGWYALPPDGSVSYAPNGDPICHECGGAYRKLGNHIAFKHHMDINDYKDKHKLLHNVSLTNDGYKTVMRKHVKKHYRKVVKKNLIKLGKATRFIIGQIVPGRGKHIKKEVNKND